MFYVGNPSQARPLDATPTQQQSIAQPSISTRPRWPPQRAPSRRAPEVRCPAEAGVEIFEYGEGRSLTPKNWLDKAMSAMRSAADEAHREDTSKRVHEAHHHSVKTGHVVGGRVFGYRNVDVFNGVDHHGRPLKSHVDRVKEEREAVVVRRIFELYDSGLGLKGIAKLLTSEGAPLPKPFIRKSDDIPSPINGWAASTVRTVLAREIYRGVVVWNKSRKRTSWGKVDQRPRPESEWIRAPKDDNLQIVSDDLWDRVVARRRDTEGQTLRFASGRLSGRPPLHGARNLLAGLATCVVCGGGLVVETSPRKRGRIPEYVCHRHRHNGTCPNALRVSVEEVNEAVLNAVEQHALTPEAVERVIRLTERDEVRERQEALDRERQDIEKRIKRFTALVETDGDVQSLVAKLRELEARRQAIDREIMALQPVPRLARTVIEDRLAEWRRLLRGSTTQGRSVLQRVLRGRLTFTPRADGRGYDFSGPTRFDKLFTGIVVERPAFITRGCTRGSEHIGPDDTFDADYGRLLDRAYATAESLEKPKRGKGLASLDATTPHSGSGKGLASLMLASWNQIAPWLRQIDGLRRAA